VSAIMESLRETNEATYSEVRGKDSARTNRIEGRVLREMVFAAASLRRAREAGEAVPALPPSKLLAKVTGAGSEPAPATKTEG